MKMSKGIRAFVENAKKTDSYWVEKAKFEFSLGLEKQRRLADMTYVSIAKKIGTSAAYITKVFRGDTNVTIETMVKLARATGGELNIAIVDKASVSVPWDVSKYRAAGSQVSLTRPSATIVQLRPRAVSVEHPEFKEAA